MESLQWTQISPNAADKEGVPIAKYDCCMVSFVTSSNEDMILIVGGAGLTKPLQPDATYVTLDNGSGTTANNEIHMYNFSTG